MRILGIDYGEKNVGLATGESETKISLARHPLARQTDSQLLADLQRLIVDEEITAVVIGRPLSLRGTDEQAARQVKAFADRLAAVTGLPVSLADERLTTQAAQRLQQQNPKASIDSLSAQIILQTYLDNVKRKT
jgi:putative Holliday junction resolvase